MSMQNAIDVQEDDFVRAKILLRFVVPYDGSVCELEERLQLRVHHLVDGVIGFAQVRTGAGAVE